MLRRYWFEFDFSQPEVASRGCKLGCGVTAYSYEDALTLVKENAGNIEQVVKIAMCRPFETLLRILTFQPLTASTCGPTWAYPFFAVCGFQRPHRSHARQVAFRKQRTLEVPGGRRNPAFNSRPAE